MYGMKTIYGIKSLLLLGKFTKLAKNSIKN